MDKIKWDRLNLPQKHIETIGKLMKTAVVDDRIDKIILFGSCAKGTSTENSDIDICLLIKHNIGWREQIELMDHDPACFPECDLVILTPKMLETGKEKAWGVTYWIVHEGVELFGN